MRLNLVRTRTILLMQRFCIFVACCFIFATAQAADLMEVYQQALVSDPKFQQALAQRLATKEAVPISVASLMPNVLVTANPSVTRSGFSGTILTRFANTTISPRNNTERAYTLALTVTQTVFDFAKFARVQGAYATSKGADAILNAALQNLMTRVSAAYFNVLKDEDNLSYSEASKLAYAEQLDQVRQQYNVGLKTVTDVYTAQASYDTAVANYIAAETKLINDRENLRAITGKYYPHLSSLSEKFPLVTPQPADVEAWVSLSADQNWSIKASQFDMETARQQIKQQVAGHLPTISVTGTLDRVFQDNINGYNSLNQRNGPGTEVDRQLMVNLSMPLFSGGGVVAQTNQAVYNYQLSQQKLEQTIRDTINVARQSYNALMSGISKIKADEQAIKSSISSLQGMEVSYRVGTETLVDVLNQQQRVYQSQTQYSTDRYDFINNILALKQAAGTLSCDDLMSLNQWLTDAPRKKIRYSYYHDQKA